MDAIRNWLQSYCADSTEAVKLIIETSTYCGILVWFLMLFYSTGLAGGSPAPTIFLISKMNKKEDSDNPS
jgi:hypothetical protein